MTTSQTQVPLRWEFAGAWTGGTIPSLTSGPTPDGRWRILAATRAGVAVTEDFGAHWHAAGQGIADPDVVAVAYAGTGTPPTAFAATSTGRLYRSTGGDWEEVTAWAGLGTAGVLVPSPDFDADRILFVGTAEGVFRTLDAGCSWESSTFGLLDTDILCLACAPDFATSHLVWTGTAGGGLYRSRNQGRAWRESGAGLPDAPVQTIAVSPAFAADRTLLVGLDGHGVYRSQDAGETWSVYCRGLENRSVYTLLWTPQAGSAGLIAATDAGLFAMADATWRPLTGAAFLAADLVWAGEQWLLAGTYLDGLMHSSDGGRTWSAAPAQPAGHAPPVVAVAASTYVALDVDGAMAASDDAGHTWQDLAGPEGAEVFGVALQVGERTTLWTATSGGLCHQDPHSGEWHVVAAEGLPSRDLLSVTCAAEGAVVLTTDASGNLAMSTDRGASWQDVTGPWPGQSLLRALTLDSFEEEPDLLVLTAQAAEQGHYAISVWQRTQGAWADLAGFATGIPAVLAAWPSKAGIFLATQHRFIRIHQDPATGEFAVDQYFFPEHEQITALATLGQAPRGPDLWVATTTGLYTSPDLGASWSHVAPLPGDRPVVLLHPEAEHMTAVTLGGHVWRAHPAPEKATHGNASV